MRFLGPSDAAALEPCAALDGAGRTWLAWIELGADARAALVVACEREGELARLAVPGERDWVAEPRLAALGDGVYLAFEESAGGARRIAGLPVRLAGGAPEAGALETAAEGPALFPRIAETRPGRLELVFAREDAATRDLRLAWRAREPGGWGAERAVDTGPGDVFAPRVAADAAGRLHLVHDAFAGGRFRVRHAVLDGGALLAARELATGAGYQGFPAVAVDAEGGAWIAWEEASQVGEIGGLRAARSLALARVAPDGAVRFAPESALPPPELRCDFPEVAVGPRGLVLAFRTLGPPFDRERAPAEGAPRPAEPRDRAYVDPEARFYTDFLTAALVFDGAGRPATWELPGTDGDNGATETLLPRADGVAAVLAADARSAARPRPSAFDSPIEGRWRVGVAELPESRGFPPLVDAPEPNGARAARPAEPRAPSALRARGDEPPVFFGDLHRHTTVSRCAGSLDGTLLDVYRYARGPGGLDFVAVTEHFQHLTPWSWWRNLREVERFHSPGRLVAFAAVERAAKGRGHRNDVYAGAGALAPPFDPAAWDAFPEERDGGPARVSVPHMTARRESPFRWREQDPALHALVEVYQGARGSYEGPGLPYAADDLDLAASSVARGLAQGRVFGLVAASDHGSSSAGLAGVRADELTREAVFAALRARAAFAATDFARLDTRLGELAMGERGPVRAGARLAVRARGLAPVAAVEVVKGGERLAYDCGAGARELFVLTSRRWGPWPDRPLAVSARGARLADARPRRRGESEARIELADGALTLSKRREPLDLVLALDGAAGGTLELALGADRGSFALASLERGRSTPLPAPADREQLLRIGPSLGAAELEREYGDLDLAAGDALWVRVLFEDGNVAWSSPVFVTEVLP